MRVRASLPMRWTVLLATLAATLYFSFVHPANTVESGVVAARDSVNAARTFATPEVTLLALRPRQMKAAVSPAAPERKVVRASPSVSAPAVVPQAVVPAPVLTYLGKRYADGRWEVFVSHHEDMLILRDGDAIDGMYRVDFIRPPTMGLAHRTLDQKLLIDIGSAE